MALIKFVALPMEKPKHEIPLTNEGCKIIIFIIFKKFTFKFHFFRNEIKRFPTIFGQFF